MRKYIFMSLVLIMVAFLVSFKNQIFLVPPALAAVLLLDPRAFRMVLRWKFLFFLGILLLGVPLLVGSKDAVLWGLPYSRKTFQASTVMVHRSIMIVLAFKVFSNHLPITEVSGTMEKLGLKSFGEVFALSTEALPEIRDIALSRMRDFRTSPRRKNIFSHLFQGLVKLLAALVLFADQYHARKNKKEF